MMMPKPEPCTNAEQESVIQRSPAPRTVQELQPVLEWLRGASSDLAVLV